MKPEVVEFEAAIQVIKRVEYISMGNGYAAYRVTVEKNIAQCDAADVFKDFAGINVKSGIASCDEVFNFAKGKTEGLQDHYEMKWVDQDFLDDLREIGYSRTMDKHHSILDEERRQIMDFVGKRGRKLVKDSLNSHMVFDVNDDPLPMALRFDYIGGITNGKYDLDRALPILRSHPLVRPMDEKTEQLEIFQIPYYNAEEKRNAALQVVFTPTQEQMKVIWFRAKELNKKYPSTALKDAVLDMDLLDIHGCLKNPVEEE